MSELKDAKQAAMELDRVQPQGLQRVESGAVAARPLPTPADMLQAVLEKGVSSESVAVVEKLVQLYEHMEARNAEKAFAQAFNGLQTEMKSVQATRAVPNNDGTIRYRFAPYETIMEQVRPMLEKHGFTVTFSTDFGDGRLIKSCTLQHTSGHSKTNKFAVRIGSGPPKASEAQADGAASTYAKRFALCDALNITIQGIDNDANAEGATITPQQADELERRVAETNSNRTAFLKLAGAAAFAEIASLKYDMLDQLLAKKEGRA